MASRTTRRIVSSSAGDARPSLYPLAKMRGTAAPRKEPTFTVLPAWRDELFKRLTAAGIEVDRKEYDAAAPYVSRLLERNLARVAFGDTAVTRRDLPHDAPLRKALELTANSQSQRDLFAALPSNVATPQKQR